MSNESVGKMPEFKVNQNKNGYEIRTEVLAMAKDLVQNEYSMKFHGWEITGTKDQNGQIITTVEMPQFPGLDKVLETAEKMYNFVSSASGGKK